ncbi:hypothetical protein F5Y10DRAFT_252763 [Nemania abortiva]|nr:hypothetical protein F5Y10DRAFT_252763 [Nemania abortiva]
MKITMARRNSAARVLYALGAYAALASALGINCRGSGLCPRASWNNNAPESIIQLLRDAVYAAPASLSTAYSSGDHVICVSQSQQITIEVGFELDGFGGSIGLSGSIGEGGICLFPQYMADGATLSLDSIRPLLDAILEHGCTTCGSVPIHFVDEGSNDPSDGILTFNYVANPYCVGNCISAVGGSAVESSAVASSVVTEEDPSTTTVFVVVETSASVDSITVQTTTSSTHPPVLTPSTTMPTQTDSGVYRGVTAPLELVVIAVGFAGGLTVV